jgi:hypothetical protein
MRSRSAAALQIAFFREGDRFLFDEGDRGNICFSAITFIPAVILEFCRLDRDRNGQGKVV